MLFERRRLTISLRNSREVEREHTVEIYDLRCKRMKTNIGGERVEDKIVAKNGQEWSIGDAARLIMDKKAVFIHEGKVVADLDTLPEY